jgi:hypothetical protein
MAQTKRKRQTKHRGNAGGVIETRGRTGRPPTAEERKQADRAKSREDRLARRPTWKQAFQRAGLAGVVMFIFLFLTDHPKSGSRVVPALAFAVIAMALYVPLGYFFEVSMWRRRMAKKQAGK